MDDLSAVSWAADAPAKKHTHAHTPKTPIEHLIVIIGENQTFDGLFATYVPKPGSTVHNLLSEGIVDGDGNPGPYFAAVTQNRATSQGTYTLDLQRAGAYPSLPQPRLIGVQDQSFHDVTNTADPRFPNSLRPGPFSITRYVPYPKEQVAPTLPDATANLSAATGDPVHRFFQMWQQTGGDNSRPDLFTWVAVTTGMGGDTSGITAKDPGQGGELMGFVNMLHGDAGYLRSLADQYAVSDNYHQFIMGGTGMNFFSIATADMPGLQNKRRAQRTAAEPDRKPESGRGLGELLSTRRLSGRLLCQLLGPATAGRGRHLRLPAEA